MTPDGLTALIEREGERLTAYKDSVGVWTIGVGHTSAAGSPAVKPGMKITKAESREILARDLVKFENAIMNAVKAKLGPHQWDSLFSICFNVGPGFAKSTCVRQINAGDVKGAADAILMWNKPKEILSRRRAERQQFLTAYDKAKPKARI